MRALGKWDRIGKRIRFRRDKTFDERKRQEKYQRRKRQCRVFEKLGGFALLCRVKSWSEWSLKRSWQGGRKFGEQRHWGV